MKILTVVGNRPQFIKAAAVSGLLRQEHQEILIHTGQHYDDSLSTVFFTELGLAKPDRELGIGGGSNESQTTRMLSALEGLIPEIAARRCVGLWGHQLHFGWSTSGKASPAPGDSHRGGHALL